MMSLHKLGSRTLFIASLWCFAVPGALSILFGPLAIVVLFKVSAGLPVNDWFGFGIPAVLLYALACGVSIGIGLKPLFKKKPARLRA